MRKLLSCSYNLRRNGNNRQRRKKEQYRCGHVRKVLQTNCDRNEEQQPVHWTTQEYAQRRLLRSYIRKVRNCIVYCRHIIPFYSEANWVGMLCENRRERTCQKLQE